MIIIIIIMDTYSGKPAQALSAYKFFTHVHIFKIQCIQHKSACAHTHTHLYIRVMALKKRVYKKRVFKEELKKLRGRMMDRNRELVPDN